MFLLTGWGLKNRPPCPWALNAQSGPVECLKSVLSAGKNAFSVRNKHELDVTEANFSEIIYNDGSWSVSGQKFTATLAGLYAFTMTFSMDSSDVRWDLAHQDSTGVEKNRRQVGNYLEETVTTATVLWQLSVGDTVAVDYIGGVANCLWEYGFYCSLSGFRVNWAPHYSCY